MPLSLFALSLAAFGIGTTEYIIMGILPDVARDLRVSVPEAGLLVSGYAYGVAFGAPIVAIATARLPRKAALEALMGLFILGNLGCAMAPSYRSLMAARVLTALAHGAFFGIGSVVAREGDGALPVRASRPGHGALDAHCRPRRAAAPTRAGARRCRAPPLADLAGAPRGEQGASHAKSPREAGRVKLAGRSAPARPALVQREREQGGERQDQDDLEVTDLVFGEGEDDDGGEHHAGATRRAERRRRGTAARPMRSMRRHEALHLRPAAGHRPCAPRHLVALADRSSASPCTGCRRSECVKLCRSHID